MQKNQSKAPPKPRRRITAPNWIATGDGTLMPVPGQSKPKQRNPQPTISRSTLQSSVNAVSGSDYVAVVCDPKNASPAAIPDENGWASVPIRDVDVFTITATGCGAVDTTGPFYFATTIAPTFYNGYSNYARATTGTPTVGGTTSTSAPNLTAITTEFSRGRMVSGLVEVRYLGAKDACQGRLAILPSTGGIANTNITTLLDTATEFDPLSGAFYRWTPTDKSEFTNLSTDAETPYAFPYINILGVGMQSGAEFEIRVIRNYEMLPIVTSLRYNDATRSHCDPAACCAAANTHTKATESGKLDDYPKVAKLAAKLAEAGAHMFFGNYVEGVRTLVKKV